MKKNFAKIAALAAVMTAGLGLIARAGGGKRQLRDEREASILTPTQRAKRLISLRRRGHRGWKSRLERMPADR